MLQMLNNALHIWQASGEGSNRRTVWIAAWKKICSCTGTNWQVCVSTAFHGCSPKLRTCFSYRIVRSCRILLAWNTMRRWSLLETNKEVEGQNTALPTQRPRTTRYNQPFCCSECCYCTWPPIRARITRLVYHVIAYLSLDNKRKWASKANNFCFQTYLFSDSCVISADAIAGVWIDY